MKTTIFSQFADLPTEFREDIDTLWNLPSEQRVALIPHTKEIYKAYTRGTREQAMEKAISEVKPLGKGKTADLLNVLKVLRFIYSAWNPVRDSLEGFQADLFELGLIPEGKDTEAKEFLKEFLSEVQSDNIRRLEASYSSKILPSFTVCNSVVDFRVVIENPFGSGQDDKVDSYQPRCLSLVPVVLLEVKCNSGDPDHFHFQCTEDDIHILIESLEAAKKEIIAARESFNLGKIEKKI